MQNHYYIYFLTNKLHTVLYTGVTNNLERRLWEHKHRFTEGFSSKYKLSKLVYLEFCENPQDAITREKQIKRWNRAKKDFLVNQTNPEWKDLSQDWYKHPEGHKGDPSTRATALGRDDNTSPVMPNEIEVYPLKRKNND